MPSQPQIDPGHQATQSLLRTLGPLCLILGVVLIAFGAYQMFSPALNDKPDPSEGFIEGRKSLDQVSHDMHRQFNDSARTSFGGFAMIAIGMVCLLAGAGMTRYGYMGKVARYAAEELTPVGADALNYLGVNTREGMRGMAESISEGINEGRTSAAALRCPSCQKINMPGAKFCNQCGHALG